MIMIPDARNFSIDRTINLVKFLEFIKDKSKCTGNRLFHNLFE